MLGSSILSPSRHFKGLTIKTNKTKIDLSKLNNFNFNQIKTLFIILLCLLGVFCAVGSLESFSFLGFFAHAQVWLFGYIGYVWAFVAAFFLWRIKEKPDFKSNRFLEKTLGVVICSFAILALQGLFFKKAGIFGLSFNSVLEPLITSLGVFVLILALFVFSIMLLSGKSFKELSNALIKELKDDLNKTKKAQKHNKESLKILSLKLKAFFTPAKTQNLKESTQEPPQETSIKEEPQKPHKPHPLTLEELIEQAKDNPPPPTHQFNFKDEEENIEVDSNLEAESLENNFESIDELRQEVELPLREDNPLEKNEEKEEQIRIISPSATTKKDFNPQIFQEHSIASLENFKHFEKSNYKTNQMLEQEKEQNKEEPIVLIKKEAQEIQKQTIKQNIESTKKEAKAPIKAYPKNLYATKPFSAYYEKTPPESKDILLENTQKKPHSAKDSTPSTIFYYGNVQSTKPLNTQELQNFKEKMQEIPQTTQDSQESQPSHTTQTIPQTTQEIPQDLAQPQQNTIEISQVAQTTQSLNVESTAAESAESIESKPQEIPQTAPHTTLEIPQDSTQPQTIEKPQLKSQEIPPQATQEKIEISQITPTLPQSTMPLFNYGYNLIQEIPQEPQAQKIVESSEIPTQIEPKQEQKVETIELFTKQTLAQPPQTTPTPQDSNTKNIEIINIQQPQEIKQNSEITQEIPQAKPQVIQPQATPAILRETKEISQAQITQPQQTTQNLNVESIAAESQQLEIPQTASIHTKTLAENTALLQELNENKTNISQDLSDTKNYNLPPLEFLQEPQNEKIEIDEIEIDKKINDLLSKLKMFKIDGDIVRTYSGPIVTTFEFRPSPNVKVSRILTLQDDLAMALRAKTIRIQAPVPGKDVVGIEIPNNQIETIYLREILENDLFKDSASPLTLALGKDIVGNPFVTDLKKLPHLLIAGTTGSGKSVGINAMILSLLYKNSPDKLRLIMIDPKMLEFSIYADIPHLLTPVITQPKKAIIALESTVKEMERRYALMAEAKIKNIEGYNEKAKIEGFEPFPYIVVIIDELADLMMSGGKEAEVPIARLAQMARASGIHIIVATQRPSVDVVTGIIKANLPSRISYKVGQKIDSKVILDTFGAESLLGRGDMLFTPPGGGIVRLHAPWSSEKEIENIVEFIKSQREPQYDDSFMPSESEILGLKADGETDELYEEAKRIMLSDGKTSISYIQRRLGIGYNKAANIIEQMEARGFLSSQNSKGLREIIGS